MPEVRMFTADFTERVSLQPASVTAEFLNILDASVMATSGFAAWYTLFAVFVLVQFRRVLKKITARARAA